MKTIKIGTRGSKLALWQANYIKDILEKENPEFLFELEIIKTTGDKILDVALSKIGDKGLFTKELENALLNNTIDLAVHSMKDVPTNIVETLEISSMPKRVDTNDIFISNNYKSFSDLPSGAKVGTSSLRRKAQLNFARKDLDFTDIRGNVDTRLAKLDNHEYDAIILAYAGVFRLGFHDRITEKIPFSTCLPATGQGAIGIQIRTNDELLNIITQKINDLETFFCVNTERVFLNKLEGGCQIPVACQAYFKDNKFNFSGLVANIEGTKILKEDLVFDFSYDELLTLDKKEQALKYKEFGLILAEKLIEQGALDIVRALRP